MVRTLSAAGPLLALLSLPGLVAHGHAGSWPLLIVSSCLAALMLGSVPMSLLRRGAPAYGWLRFSAVVYLALLVLESSRLGTSTLMDSPWLIGLSCTAFSCLAVAIRHSLAAGAACAGTLALLVWTYAGHAHAGPLVVDALGLAVIAGALIAFVRTLRRRARRADAAELRARGLFESSRRHAAIVEERVRTDALLHDTVLATLLAAAGRDAVDRTVLMARSALDIVSGTVDHPESRSETVRFDTAVTAAGNELAPMRGLVRLDLAEARAVQLPSAVAETIVAAMLQALSNSITHAGPSAIRTATAAATTHGGLRITVRDDGCGFDPTRMAPGQLGVRVSILERMRQVGASAEIRSAPGAGTTVLLEWHPGRDAAPGGPPESGDRLTLIPRKVLYGTMAALIVVAVVAATVQTALVYRAIGPVIAALLGSTILPAMVRGARSGRMSTTTAWVVTAVGCAVCSTSTIGLTPDEVDPLIVSWLTFGVLAGSVLVWMTGHRLQPLVAVTYLVVTVAVWSGPVRVIHVGLAAEIVLTIAGLMMHRALREVADITRIADAAERESLLWHAELDAFHLERQDRLRAASQDAAPMLRHIIERGGDLDPTARAGCRILEQTLRDEIRGRNLLNDDLRTVILTHRRRGALVQVLDDGGLDDLAPSALDALLDEVARRLRPVRSSRIVIRTGRPDSGIAITIVASSPDETAAALGLDADDDVELWESLPHPTTATSTPA
jgi:signal transduction histidine kinase